MYFTWSNRFHDHHPPWSTISLDCIHVVLHVHSTFVTTTLRYCVCRMLESRFSSTYKHDFETTPFFDYNRRWVRLLFPSRGCTARWLVTRDVRVTCRWVRTAGVSMAKLIRVYGLNMIELFNYQVFHASLSERFLVTWYAFHFLFGMLEVCGVVGVLLHCLNAFRLGL